MVRRTLAALATTAVLLAAVAGTALAGSHQPTTPNGWVGACNMMLAGDGMDNAMDRNDSQNNNGNNGMANAVDRSGDCLNEE